MSNTENRIFDPTTAVAPLGIIALKGATELGKRINEYFLKWRAPIEGEDPETRTFLIEADCPRFQSGDGKGFIKQTVRGKDLFIICDMANYSCTYKMFGKENAMSPDDHFQDLKRIIQAASGKAHRINVIMPILYGGRQHRRAFRESLDCAVALQELAAMGVQNIITFDAHDPRVQNAIPLTGFDNIMPSYQVLKAMMKTFPDMQFDKDHFMVVSPDEGAIGRNMYYASVLGVDLGMFYKRRDYSTIVNGRNPIVAHEFMGNDVAGKVVFIADDLISSGESMLDIAIELKKRNAKSIICYATYGMFTNGLKAFDEKFADGTISAVFGTNLTYRMPELLASPWFHEVDCTKYIAYYISTLNHDMSISEVIDPHQKIAALLAKHNHSK